MATGGRDGYVRVWDPRQQDAPVAALEPTDPAKVLLAASAGILLALHLHYSLTRGRYMSSVGRS